MQRVYGAALGTTFVIVMLNGCVGDDPDSSNGTSVTPDGGPTPPGEGGRPPDLAPDAAPSALCPLGCLPPAPNEWIGPSAVYDGAEPGKPSECPSPYTVKEVDAHLGMTAPAPSCSCGTSVVKDRKCTAVVGVYSDGACTNPTFSAGTASSTAPCLKTTVANGSHYKVEPPTLVPGTCTYPNKTFTVPPITFERVQVACGLPQAAACDTRPDCVASPVPAQPYTRLCIHRDGDVSCPSEDYAVKVLTHKKVDDKRACSACVESAATGGSCGNNWGQNATEPECSATPPSNRTVGSCYAYSVGALVNIAAMGPTSADCPAQTGGQAVGAVTSIEPVTFCCNR